MNLSLEDIDDILRSDNPFFQESFQDFEGTALQVFVRLFEKFTVPADEMNKRFFL
jgi:hypothetical protein